MVTFDNSYSWARSKTLHYCIDVLKPGSGDVYDDLNTVVLNGDWSTTEKEAKETEDKAEQERLNSQLDKEKEEKEEEPKDLQTVETILPSTVDEKSQPIDGIACVTNIEVGVEDVRLWNTTMWSTVEQYEETKQYKYIIYYSTNTSYNYTYIFGTIEDVNNTYTLNDYMLNMHNYYDWILWFSSDTIYFKDILYYTLYYSQYIINEFV